jgi:hypothetical protein
MVERRDWRQKMVVNVYVEGGIVNGNVDATTNNNSEALREELNRFMQRALNRNDISIVVKKCSGYKEAAKQFINATDEADNYLYVDLDRKPELRDEWFKSLSDDGIEMSQDKSDHVSFWIQEMEAWFLKQPECLDRWGKAQGFLRQKKGIEIAADNQIAGKDIEGLSKPSKIVGVFVQRYFERVLPNGKPQKVKYGKLKSAPGIIDQLDENTLVAVDRELLRFKVLF